MCPSRGQTFMCYHSVGRFSVGLVGKESACNSGDPASILGLGRCPGGGNGNPL